MNNPAYITVKWQSNGNVAKSSPVINPIGGVEFIDDKKVTVDIQKIEAQIKKEKKITKDVEILSIEFSLTK